MDDTVRTLSCLGHRCGHSSAPETMMRLGRVKNTETIEGKYSLIFLNTVGLCSKNGSHDAKISEYESSLAHGDEIDDDGLRLDSVQKGSPKTARNRKKKAIDMATLRRQPRSRTASTRQDRGSCSSTASCPVFSGPYSDHEEDTPLRHQSSPLLKGSLCTLHNSKTSNPKDPISRLQGSLPTFQSSLLNLRESISRLKRRSLGSLDNSSPSPSEWSKSPSLQSGSSSDDDGSWDTNSWSSGATCLLRTPVKQDSTETSGESAEKSCASDQGSTTAKAEPEIIYQNLIYTNPPDKPESKGDSAPERTPTVLRKDAGIHNVSSSCTTAISSHQEDEVTEDRRKFSQFLNEVTCRVLKSNSGPSQQPPTLRHRFPSPPPPPISTPSHPPPTTTLPLPPIILASLSASASATNLWYSPTCSNLQTIEEHESKDITKPIHRWSKTLPSCKILEPGDALTKLREESHSYQNHKLELCTKIQSQPSTGRVYLETDIDRVRRLDDLVANGTLGAERNEKGLEKGVERGKENENRISWDGGMGMEKGKEMENPWDRHEKGREKEKGPEKPCWEKDERIERGRDKVKKLVLSGHEPPPPPSGSSGGSNPCPVFSWPEGFPRVSYRSASLPRPVNITVSMPPLG
ncbi:hypothetical protein Q5P01_020182 [Channa striata]|uniref:Uncharacterized protein n=1 Tax=Channa striata TaxID=64152 RepID=A0AA88S1P6_CHASR|nr:hypothetical protein Q5P01_020182 [Channa striata]